MPGYASSKRSQNHALLLPSLRTYLIGRELKENRNDEDGNDVDHLDHWINRGAGGVLIGVAHRVACYCRGVGGGAFAAVIPFFDKFFGVIPGATATRITNASGNSAGTIISRNAAFVTMSTHVPYSGVSSPRKIPGCACNCRRTSRTTAPAALPTASMLKAVKMNGSSPPMNKPIITFGSLSEKSNTNGSPFRVTCALSSCTYEPNKRTLE